MPSRSWFTHLSRWFALLTLLGLLLTPLPVARANAPQVSCTAQSTPYFTEYYGDVMVGGASAPIGAVVEAVNHQGVQAGCFVVTIPGIYGYMRVYGADAATGTPGMAGNEAVIFKVNGAVATSVPASMLWSGDNGQHEVDLSAQALPTAVENLEVEIDANGDVLLTWSDVGNSADHYEVWRSSAPYFSPVPEEGTLIAPNVPRPATPGDPVSFPDETGTSHLGNPDVNDTYVVLAVGAGGVKSLVSNRVAEFDFSLQPGG